MSTNYNPPSEADYKVWNRGWNSGYDSVLKVCNVHIARTAKAEAKLLVLERNIRTGKNEVYWQQNSDLLWECELCDIVWADGCEDENNNTINFCPGCGNAINHFKDYKD